VELLDRAADVGGRAKHLSLDVDRLAREKSQLLQHLQSESERYGALEADFFAIKEHARQLEQLAAAEKQRADDLERHRDILADDQQQKGELIGRLYGEVERLNQLLTTIYGSRTWKVHEMVERMKRR
jgi:predicted  nucleic acid-binding Zn-ribbon protein